MYNIYENENEDVRGRDLPDLIEKISDEARIKYDATENSRATNWRNPGLSNYNVPLSSFFLILKIVSMCILVDALIV